MKEHRARKRFGQNFLGDPGVVRRIGEAIGPGRSDHVVEIGPGLGALTAELAASDCRLDVVELDRDLVPALRGKFGDRLTVHEADALTFDFSALRTDRPLRLVGNLPYNIATPLIFRLLDHCDCAADMHFMLQLEVANRMAAHPGGKDWGKLGVMAQYRCEVESLFEVPPEAFSPPPKVQSALVRLRPRPGQRDRERESRLRTLVSAAFAQRRKTLRNNLRDLLDVQQLEGLKISPSARAETLSLEQLLAMSDLLADREGANR